MPHYHFNVTDGHSVALDGEGAELSDHDAARAEALASAQHLLASSDEKGWCRRHWRIDVTSDSGKPLFSLPFSHALVPDQLAASNYRQRN